MRSGRGRRRRWRDVRERLARGGCWGTVGSCWLTSLLPRPHLLLPTDAPPALIYVYPAASCPHSRTYPKRALSSLLSMKGHEWQEFTILSGVPALLPHIHEDICWSVQCRHLDRPLVSGRRQGWTIPTISPLWEALQSYATCRQSSQCTFPVCFLSVLFVWDMTSSSLGVACLWGELWVASDRRQTERVTLMAQLSRRDEL